MKNGKLGYAVLGLGIGMAHADAAYHSERAELVAVCDVDEKRLAKAQKRYADVTAYTQFEDLLADDRVDVISVSHTDAESQYGITEFSVFHNPDLLFVLI